MEVTYQLEKRDRENLFLFLLTSNLIDVILGGCSCTNLPTKKKRQ